MLDYTIGQINMIFNNHPCNKMSFKDPYSDCVFIIETDDGWFNTTTLLNNVIRRTGRVHWSESEQAFTGDGYNIPMSWNV